MNDFSLYDHVLDMTCLLGNIPQRFKHHIEHKNTIDLMFSMARSSLKDVHACEMTKWFNTNYHFCVATRVWTNFKHLSYGMHQNKVHDFITA